MQFLSLIVFGSLALVVTYFLVSVYSRSIRREKLEDWWDEEPLEGTDRGSYIAEGMARYESGLRKKLILLIFVIPPIVVFTIIFFVN